MQRKELLLWRNGHSEQRLNPRATRLEEDKGGGDQIETRTEGGGEAKLVAQKLLGLSHYCRPFKNEHRHQRGGPTCRGEESMNKDK